MSTKLTKKKKKQSQSGWRELSLATKIILPNTVAGAGAGAGRTTAVHAGAGRTTAVRAAAVVGNAAATAAVAINVASLDFYRHRPVTDVRLKRILGTKRHQITAFFDTVPILKVGGPRELAVHLLSSTGSVIHIKDGKVDPVVFKANQLVELCSTVSGTQHRD